jgi:hypothetical protein
MVSFAYGIIFWPEGTKPSLLLPLAEEIRNVKDRKASRNIRLHHKQFRRTIDVTVIFSKKREELQVPSEESRQNLL